MPVIVSFLTNTFFFVFQRVFSWFCAADEPVVSLKCGGDGSLETGSLEGLRARASLPRCSGKTWIKRCPKIEDHGKLFISQRLYSCFPPSLLRSILSLQLKNAYPGPRGFSWNFSLRERERAAEPRKRVAKGRGEGEGFFPLSSPLATRSL